MRNKIIGIILILIGILIVIAICKIFGTHLIPKDLLEWIYNIVSIIFIAVGIHFFQK